ncbi:PaaI family thioesterase [Bordetella petrii]|uniref:PaaI family thioesterase n=1 Tax=Bordetella petrii TaxID=94624 RepID=UPI001E5B43DB|nr:PaaI family thioesterase [Bordetella petrii]MCD0503811.1 PaaI family thioesterase [Bordetella petrii]
MIGQLHIHSTPMSGFEHNPFLHSLGAVIDNWGDGRIVLSMDLRPSHLNRQGALQGGVVCALLDAACGYSGIVPQPGNQQDNAVTISLAINFIGSVTAGQVRATGIVTGRGRKIYFARAEVSTADGRILATAQGSFKYGGPRLMADPLPAEASA